MNNEDSILAKERFLQVKSMIAEYIEVGDKTKITRLSPLTSPITVKDIILLPFISNIRSKNYDQDMRESVPMLKNVDQKKVNAYLSTPRFIKYLTDISEAISKEQDKKAALKRELRRLNQHLPASVYIPFTQDSLRNYAVLHIHPDEVHVFQTKSRCPYMITIEMYRPDEMSMASPPEPTFQEKRNSRKPSTERRGRKESLDLSDYDEPLIPAEMTDDLFQARRGKSNSLYLAKTNRIESQAEEKISKPLFISFIGKRPEVRDTIKDVQNNIGNAEKKVSRFLLEDGTPRVSEVKDEESFEKASVDIEEDKEDYQNLSFQKSSYEEDDDPLNKSTYSSPAVIPSPLKLTKSKTGEPPVKKSDKSDSRSEKNNSEDDDGYYSKNDLNDILSQRDEEEESYSPRKSRSSSVASMKGPTNFLFKETFEQQSERLRKASIFGSLKTWKIMKMIVKSGDDLRQEQFAMQIIDIMSQIFEVQGVGCWLHPYEILATDNGCGIMVCLKDSMSIDQIKKTLPSGMSTLKDYFLYNFGGQRSAVYKEARHNFAKSLAGYSLL